MRKEALLLPLSSPAREGGIFFDNLRLLCPEHFTLGSRIAAILKMFLQIPVVKQEEIYCASFYLILSKRG